MTAPADQVVRFPMKCQGCGAASAMPYVAGTSRNSRSISVGMRCRDCGHEWQFEMPVAAHPETPDAKGSHRLDAD